jgi:hypothetical protein
MSSATAAAATEARKTLVRKLVLKRGYSAGGADGSTSL